MSHTWQQLRRIIQLHPSGHITEEGRRGQVLSERLALFRKNDSEPIVCVWQYVYAIPRTMHSSVRHRVGLIPTRCERRNLAQSPLPCISFLTSQIIAWHADKGGNRTTLLRVQE